MKVTKNKTIEKRLVVGRPAPQESMICENEITGPESLTCWRRKWQK